MVVDSKWVQTGATVILVPCRILHKPTGNVKNVILLGHYILGPLVSK